MNGRDWKILELENMRRDDYYTKWAIKAKEEMQRKHKEELEKSFEERDKELVQRLARRQTVNEKRPVKTNKEMESSPKQRAASETIVHQTSFKGDQDGRALGKHSCYTYRPYPRFISDDCRADI